MKDIDPSVPFAEYKKKNTAKPKAVSSSYEKIIDQIKYIMQHSPQQDRWNNIWTSGVPFDELVYLKKSLSIAGIKLEEVKNLESVTCAVNVLLDKALEKGLSDPVWGETLTTIKNARERLNITKSSSSERVAQLESGNASPIVNSDVRKEIDKLAVGLGALSLNGNGDVGKEIDKLTVGLGVLSLNGNNHKTQNMPPLNLRAQKRKVYIKN